MKGLAASTVAGFVEKASIDDASIEDTLVEEDSVNEPVLEEAITDTVKLWWMINYNLSKECFE